MTPFLEWIGCVPAAVSAVHALGALERVRQKKAADSEPAALLTSGQHHGCDILAVTGCQGDAAGAKAVAMRVEFTFRAAFGCGASGSEDEPW
ncbi:hypothetical protein GCM10010222_80480 [Streptomyces tanashiensis]|uniref:hypothetical protein n=1 Tax=Streptomyces tanashiensis TaxID=67367 RepID=UPI00167324D2|nr:hypothetical protein [Streptomyces tanashiensis]GGT26572.1 hypothetical protein GCM10010222_80480 [Streptomyces tanashiensis]